MQLTDRDRDIIRLVCRHRILRSSHVVALVGGNMQQILRRLKLLYHHRFLDRPRAQLDYYHDGGSRPIVYGMGSESIALHKREHSNLPERNPSVGRMFLQHELFVSDIMVAIELASRQAGVRLLTEEELAPQDARTGKRPPFFWRVNVSGSKLSASPDRVFALEWRNAEGENTRAIFFLEADRGTMPIIRKNLSQTSFYRKLVAYEATWLQGVHRRRFGFNRFRVLTVTTSAARVESLIEACSKLKSGHGLFLFADRSILEKPDSILSAIWHTGHGAAADLLH
jgi:hypothetical protein